MPGATHIEWTDATWNPVTGCSKISAGCKFCYAERDFHRPYPGRKFTDVRIHPERLDWPLRWRGSKQAKAEGRPSRIFVNSMSDLFHEDVPPEFILRVIAKMAICPQHNFQILTKRPERMRELLANVPSIAAFKNMWWGVSVEGQPTADERIPLLLQTPAAVRFVSYEPALGPVDLGLYVQRIIRAHPEDGPFLHERRGPLLDWVIAGGESGPHARPSRPDWLRAVRDQCVAAGVTFFFKQWGEWVGFEDSGQHYADAPKVHAWPHGVRSYWVGKREAPRTLDGREWNEFPLARGAHGNSL